MNIFDFISNLMIFIWFDDGAPGRGRGEAFISFYISLFSILEWIEFNKIYLTLKLPCFNFHELPKMWIRIIYKVNIHWHFHYEFRQKTFIHTHVYVSNKNNLNLHTTLCHLHASQISCVYFATYWHRFFLCFVCLVENTLKSVRFKIVLHSMLVVGMALHWRCEYTIW